MNRLQKKCFVGSAGVHGLLAGILLVGPGFLSSRSKPNEMAVLDAIPAKTVEDLISGGGERNVRPPTPQATQTPAPPLAVKPPPEPVKPPPEPQRPKDAVIEQPKPPKVEDQTEPSVEPAKRKLEISKTLVTRQHDAKADAKAREEAREKQAAKEWADSRKRLARELDRVAGNLTSDVSGATTLKIGTPGFGGGGASYANFNQSVMTVYKRAWSGTVPNDSTDDDVEAVASVTIARDGTVVSWRITKSSGRPGVDRSVRAVLERVTFVVPLPEGSKEDQRTVEITFAVNAKKGIG
jgi:TonB family protein